MSKGKYRMSISLNVLDHLGLKLYSNTPAVIAEVVANAWDADASKVEIAFDTKQQSITIVDDGHGMDLADINDKYLHVGYQRREVAGPTTPNGRVPMGRKGIGKLSLFSIANKIRVHSRKDGREEEAFEMDAAKIREKIKRQGPSTSPEYKPQPITGGKALAPRGTVITITQLKRKLTRASIAGLKRQVARRFGMHLADFAIFIDGKEVTPTDRDYFHKARFLYQYGADYATHCDKLDPASETDAKLETVAGKAMCFSRLCRFNDDGEPVAGGQHEVRGWIAVARRSNDLSDKRGDNNLNKISIVVRGKVAQEDILQEIRLGAIITKYIYGEIYADFLDADDEADIATSSRQKISEEDPRYIALKAFVRKELAHIRDHAGNLQAQKGLEAALSANPFVKEWYDGITPKSLRKTAEKIFADIEKSATDEASKSELYETGILAFEALKMHQASKLLDEIDVSNMAEFLQIVTGVDAIEAARYRQIVEGRLKVIGKLQDCVDENVKERVLQEYVFDHLWLLDPAWERATQYAYMEKAVRAATAKDAAKDDPKSHRVDIRYKRVMAGHVIVELKRAGRPVDASDLQKQVLNYKRAVSKKLKQMNDPLPDHIDMVCIVGRLPDGWDDPDEKREAEGGLRHRSIRVLTYDELIHNAYSAYSKFIETPDGEDRLWDLIERMRGHKAQ